MIADGKTANEIAKELWVSIHTVRSTLRNSITKKNARNLRHLVAITLREGEIQ